ncbi:hypothetical protein G6F52_013939 [Rhizopus delemar]|nr:hypothetical protein G6F52_013939 [Rhizopus delemar]
MRVSYQRNSISRPPFSGTLTRWKVRSRLASSSSSSALHSRVTPGRCVPICRISASSLACTAVSGQATSKGAISSRLASAVPSNSER